MCDHARVPSRSSSVRNSKNKQSISAVAGCEYAARSSTSPAPPPVPAVQPRIARSGVQHRSRQYRHSYLRDFPASDEVQAPGPRASLASTPVRNDYFSSVPDAAGASVGQEHVVGVRNADLVGDHASPGSTGRSEAVGGQGLAGRGGRGGSAGGGETAKAAWAGAARDGPGTITVWPT